MEKKNKRGAHLKQYSFKTNPHFISPGRAKGSKNRSTLAKRLLAGEIDGMTYEEQITIAQLKKAYDKGDTNAYKAIMDSAYGPAQTNDTVDGELHAGLRPLFGDKMEEDEIEADDSFEGDQEDQD